MVVVDDTTLKGKYKGCMLVVVPFDSDNKLYPLVYETIDKETNSSWTYFLS